MKDRLEEIRKERGIKQEELAAALEVSRQTIGSVSYTHLEYLLLAFVPVFPQCGASGRSGVGSGDTRNAP